MPERNELGPDHGTCEQCARPFHKGITGGTVFGPLCWRCTPRKGGKGPEEASQTAPPGGRLGNSCGQPNPLLAEAPPEEDSGAGPDPVHPGPWECFTRHEGNGVVHELTHGFGRSGAGRQAPHARFDTLGDAMAARHRFNTWDLIRAERDEAREEVERLRATITTEQPGPAACRVEWHSSRTCERGTDSCVVRHEHHKPDAEPGRDAVLHPQAVTMARGVLRGGAMNDAITLRLARSIDEASARAWQLTAERDDLRIELGRVRRLEQSEREKKLELLTRNESLRAEALSLAGELEKAKAWASEQRAKRWQSEVKAGNLRARARGASVARGWIACAVELPQPRTVCAVIFEGGFAVARCVLWDNGCGPERRWVREGNASPHKLGAVTHWQALTVPAGS